ncbi:hypothetical protein D104_11455 [Marinomonas profundimaris]|uniref:Uncharacterized protein n=1 Tax=Marinomonas profundimaris TaxID=1208321 RepID=W1RT19_9GAMM|nr:hypothetical protein D104_11455 [Marinomonas profundimaris]
MGIRPNFLWITLCKKIWTRDYFVKKRLIVNNRAYFVQILTFPSRLQVIDYFVKSLKQDYFQKVHHKNLIFADNTILRF